MKQDEASAARTAQERFWVLRKGVVEFWHVDPGQARYGKMSILKKCRLEVEFCLTLWEPLQRRWRLSKHWNLQQVDSYTLTQRRNRTSKMISRILVCFPFCPGFLHAHYLLCLGQVVPDDSGVSRPECHSNCIDLRDSYQRRDRRDLLPQKMTTASKSSNSYPTCIKQPSGNGVAGLQFLNVSAKKLYQFFHEGRWCTEVV